MSLAINARLNGEGSFTTAQGGAVEADFLVKSLLALCLAAKISPRDGGEWSVGPQFNPRRTNLGMDRLKGHAARHCGCILGC